MKKNISLFLPCVLFLFISCKKETENTIEPESLYEEGEEILGGVASTYDQGRRSFENEVAGLTIEQKLAFFTGNSLFKQAWVSAPATTTARDGLGPLFNAKSCGACHPNDGRGRPPEFSGEKQSGLLFRLGSGTDGAGNQIFDPVYGGQLQDMSIQKIDYDGDMEILFNEILSTFSDGTSRSLRSPTYSVSNLAYGTLGANTTISPRVGPQVIGLGLLDAISEQDILANEDELDADGDGVSGRANWVWDEENKTTKIGRFGWKANQPSLRQQIAGAFNGDLGVTSSIFPEENCAPWFDCDTVPNGDDGEHELTDNFLMQSEIYLAALSVPVRRNAKDDNVLKGKLLFAEIGCNNCHIDEFRTSVSPVLSVLNNQTIRPYTDLLLHDMGEGLADNTPDFLANGQEWRTPPLWGIGLIQTVNGHQFLLHDGRARDAEEAILWHGGEGENSKEKYKELCEEDRENLLKFLESL